MTEPTEPVCLFTFKEVPYKWQAGKSGEDPFYFPCCECDSEDLHWVLVRGSQFDFLKVVSRKQPNGSFKMAAFCKDHKPASRKSYDQSVIKPGDPALSGTRLRHRYK